MDPNEIIKKTVIVEGHRDIYEALNYRSHGRPNPIADIVFRRLDRNGIDLCVYAVSGDSHSHISNTNNYTVTTYENLDFILNEIKNSDGFIKLILEKADLPSKKESGVIRVLLNIEGGKALNGDLGHLRNFHRLGVRSLQPTWNLRNELGDGVWEERTKGGLTNFGISVIKELNRLNMLIDLSHMTRKGFFDALEVGDGPIIVSHANASSVYRQIRSIDDDQIKAIAERKGLVGIMAIAKLVKSGKVSVEDLVNHLEYMVNLVGIDYVGLGFDFTKYDGPRPLKDKYHPQKRKHEPIQNFEEIEDLPNLVSVLQKRGFKYNEIKKILGENYLRVLNEVL